MVGLVPTIHAFLRQSSVQDMDLAARVSMTLRAASTSLVMLGLDRSSSRTSAPSFLRTSETDEAIL
jgi:hypothetical protein